MSIFRRMPSGLNPIASHLERVGVIGQVECRHCGAADRRHADNPQAVVAPMEVIGPRIGTRIEKPHQFPGLRVARLGSAGLRLVAQGASEPQVGFVVRTALRPWDYVLDLEPGEYQVLGTMAVAATIPSRVTDAARDFDRDSGTCQARQPRGGARPRSTATFRARAFRTKSRR